MKLRSTILSLLVVSMFIAAKSQTPEPQPEIFKGNELYKKKQYDKANAAYQEALLKNPSNAIANFNSGNANFRQNKFDEAIKSFDNTINNTRDKNLQQQAYYNKGVALSKQQKLAESIEAWKEALKLSPNDKETRENLEKALREKKQEEEKQKKKNKQQEKQEKQKSQPKSKLNQQQVEQLLRALQEKEKDVNSKLNQNKVPAPTKPDKDW